jgi:hypothetical protein
MAVGGTGWGHDTILITGKRKSLSLVLFKLHDAGRVTAGPKKEDRLQVSKTYVEIRVRIPVHPDDFRWLPFVTSSI